MVMCSKDAPRAATPPAAEGNGARRRNGYGDGGPVFVPSRELSPLARALLSSPADERVTAYDEIWYLGRPQQA